MSGRNDSSGSGVGRAATLGLVVLGLALLGLVIELRLAVFNLAGEARSLQVEVEALRQEVRARSSSSGGASELSPVSGPGVIVTLDDSEAPPGRYLHDQDLLVLVNELRAAGATAIAVSGQRLGALSEIRCAGNHIRVNGKAIVPPYVVQATGEPQVLRAGLEIRDGIIDQLRRYGFRADLAEADQIAVPALQSVNPS